MDLAHDKLIQSMAAFIASIGASFIRIPAIIGQNGWIENFLLFGQVISVWLLVLVGVVKFKHYLSDRKKKKNEGV